MMKTAIAPGKLILSGEHSVVHGAPAIAMAVNRYAKATAIADHEPLVSLNLLNLEYHKSMTKKALKDFKHRLGQSYEAFKQGEIGIKEVLKLPFELSQYALSHFLEAVSDKHEHGLKITTESDIPMSAGMGSSAAMILAVMHAMALAKDKIFDKDYYFEHALAAENLQHGTSSGLDIRMSLHGGCLWFENQQFEALPLPTLPITVVNTGKPKSSTGECVSHTKTFFEDQTLINQFTELTHTFALALKNNQLDKLAETIKKNHRLLIDIGVIPLKVQQFIAALEAQGFAAKICGAGSIFGDEAGMVIILGKNPPLDFCQSYGFSTYKIEGDVHGLRAH